MNKLTSALMFAMCGNGGDHPIVAAIHVSKTISDALNRDHATNRLQWDLGGQMRENYLM